MTFAAVVSSVVKPESVQPAIQSASGSSRPVSIATLAKRTASAISTSETCSKLCARCVAGRSRSSLLRVHRRDRSPAPASIAQWPRARSRRCECHVAPAPADKDHRHRGSRSACGERARSRIGEASARSHRRRSTPPRPAIRRCRPGCRRSGRPRCAPLAVSINGRWCAPGFGLCASCLPARSALPARVHLLHVHRLALVSEAGIASDDEHPWQDAKSRS